MAGGPVRSRAWAATAPRRAPDAERRLHAHHIGQAVGRDARAERAVNAITGVGQQDPRRDAGRKRSPDLIERDLGFGRKRPSGATGLTT